MKMGCCGEDGCYRTLAPNMWPHADPTGPLRPSAATPIFQETPMMFPDVNILTLQPSASSSHANGGALLGAAGGSASERAALFPSVTKADSWRTQSPLSPTAAESPRSAYRALPPLGSVFEKMHKPGGRSSSLTPLEKNLVSFGGFSIAVTQRSTGCCLTFTEKRMSFSHMWILSRLSS